MSSKWSSLIIPRENKLMMNLPKTAVLLSLVSALFVPTALERPYTAFVSADPTPDQGRWAVIEDTRRDSLRVETVSDEVWAQLFQLYYNRSERWIGGIVETYENQWGFRFDPKTIIVAEVTIEVWQTTIRGISENLAYWLGKMAVVGAKVVEIHQSSPVGGIIIPVDKVASPAPYIALAFIILIATAATATYVKLKRGKEE